VPKTTGGSKEMFSKKPLQRDLIRAQVFLCLSDYRSKNEELIKPTKQNKTNNLSTKIANSNFTDCQQWQKLKERDKKSLWRFPFITFLSFFFFQLQKTTFISSL
jgi:hypothetical protein